MIVKNLNQRLIDVGDSTSVFEVSRPLASSVAIVSAAGSATADATEVQAGVVWISTAGASTGIRPVSVIGGMSMAVYNGGANVARLYAPTGGYLHGTNYTTAYHNLSVGSGMQLAFLDKVNGIITSKTHPNGIPT